MSLIQFGETRPSNANIKVIGVGGAGGNAVNAMINASIEGVDFIAINTDLQVLEKNLASRRIQIGKNVTRGLGAGANPDIGEKAIEEDKEEVMSVLANADMVFITAGMGGGTGTGAAHVIAGMAKSMGALTIGIVTRPFQFEGFPRKNKAEKGIENLRKNVDTLIVIPNDRLFNISGQNTQVLEAFKLADDVLLQATRGISDIITNTGFINLDFSDVKTIMIDKGDALMGSGIASGANRATISAQEAISSPLLEGVSIKGALGVLINITGSQNLTINEVQEAANLIHEQAGENANVIFGMALDDSMGDQVRVTVIATGFNSDAKNLQTLNQSKSQKEKIEPIFDSIQDQAKATIKKESFRQETNQIPINLDSSIPPFMKNKTTPGIDEFKKNVIEKEDQSFDSEKSKPEQKPSEDLDIPTFLRKSMD